MLLQPISNIAEIFARKAIKRVVLSPGSRCAPLTLAFARHSEIQTFVIPDERSAGFIALGMAQNLNETVGVVCTSGTALLNLYPSIAEAYFQEIPLVVLTADRPPELIDQWDGQTIFQEDVYGKHVKQSFTLPVDINEISEPFVYQTISQAINLASSNTKGPVHINVPLREPFYPEAGEEIVFSKDIKWVDKIESTSSPQDEDLDFLIDQWHLFHKKLILVGQNKNDPNLIQLLASISQKESVPVLGDIISNVHTLTKLISSSDLFLGKNNSELFESIRPDLLITMGASTISKNVKTFLRNFPAKEHWHIQTGTKVRDPFHSLTKLIQIEPVKFLRELEKLETKESFEQQKQNNYFELWQLEDHKTKKNLDSFFINKSFGEWEAVKEILESLPSDSILHLANSMPVRLANFCGLKPYQQVEVYCNRGTSGIDGCSSTAMGTALSTKKPVILLTGDVAFFYDRNSFWHNYSYNNLRVVLLNNHGGGIFRIINGPSNQPELEEYFETKQPLNAELTAKEFGLDYFICTNSDDLSKVWDAFFNFDGKAKILEIETDSKVNASIFNEFRKITEN